MVPVGVSLAQMETPACSCPSEPAPDESTTFNFEAAGIELEAMLPDPCTMFKLDAGVNPMLPDPGTAFKLEAGIKPKQEPCEEDAPPAWAAAAADDDSEITPLSGSQPFFSTVLSRCHVAKSFQLVIPKRLQALLPEARVPAVLLCGGRSWTTSYCGDLKWKKFEVASWRVFAADNRLRVGDACVFELVSRDSGKALVFRVQVLRGDLPEEVTSRGATSDEPLVIVD